MGENCNRRANQTARLNPCSSNPCYGLNSVCNKVSENEFSCTCGADQAGPLCNSHRGPCACQNGATCNQIETSIFSCNYFI